VKKIVAIVPSAGIGKRFGLDKNKPFHLLCNKPVIIWSLKTLSEIEYVKDIIPVVKEEDIEFSKKLFQSYKLTKIKKIAIGGKERQDSVYNGLKLVKDKDCLVLIHDAVRPLIRKELIEEAIKELLKANKSEKNKLEGIVFGVPAKDTLKEVKDNIITKTLKRENIWMIQTPQIFYYKPLYNAYMAAIKENFYSTDDSALVERYGGKVKVFMGMYNNIKITTPEDITYAEFLIKSMFKNQE
jgi:2-C-methyl-D-erythritol 4-phosphate cytidylyltransferase